MFKNKYKKNIDILITEAKTYSHTNKDILSKQKSDEIKSFVEKYNAQLANADSADYKEISNNIDEEFSTIIPKKHTIHEYLDIIVVVLCVAFGLRAIFIQPFAIPTGSMQPTLFGQHYIENKLVNEQPIFSEYVPAFLRPLVFSSEKFEFKVKNGDVLNLNDTKNTGNFFLTKTSLNVNNNYVELPGKMNQIMAYSGLREDIRSNWRYDFDVVGDKQIKYKKDKTLNDGWWVTGDHLFVERVSQLLFGPQRGDITVFTTENLKMGRNPSGFYYVKRLIGMPGDTIKIINDTIYIKEENATKFKAITEFGIESINRIYSKKGGYHGHYNEGMLESETDTFTVPKNHYFMCGDNSQNSFDSRYWGSVPRENIIGKPICVFWPFSRRWGRVDNNPPLDIDTDHRFLKSMKLQ